MLPALLSQPTEHVVELAHVRSAAPFTSSVMLAMPPEDTLAFAEIVTLVPLTVAPFPGDVMLTAGTGTDTSYHLALFVTGLHE